MDAIPPTKDALSPHKNSGKEHVIKVDTVGNDHSRQHMSYHHQLTGAGLIQEATLDDTPSSKSVLTWTPVLGLSREFQVHEGSIKQYSTVPV